MQALFLIGIVLNAPVRGTGGVSRSRFLTGPARLPPGWPPPQNAWTTPVVILKTKKVELGDIFPVYGRAP